MTETASGGTDLPAETPEGETPSLEALDHKVDGIIETLKKILHPGEEAPTQATAEGEGPDIGAEVRSELAKLKAAEDRKAAREKQAGEIDELKQAVAKIKERPPKEYRRVTNLVWGRDED